MSSFFIDLFKSYTTTVVGYMVIMNMLYFTQNVVSSSLSRTHLRWNFHEDTLTYRHDQNYIPCRFARGEWYLSAPGAIDALSRLRSKINGDNYRKSVLLTTLLPDIRRSDCHLSAKTWVPRNMSKTRLHYCNDKRQQSGSLNRLCACVKAKGGHFEYRVILDVMNNFQPLPAFMLIFIAMVIRFCDRLDLIELIFVLVIAHRKRAVWNFIGLNIA